MPDPPLALAASCTVVPAHTVPGVAVADVLRAPPVTFTVIWSEFTHVVDVDVAVRVNTVIVDRFTVLVVRLAGVVTCAIGVQL